jgi:hypothetical protein
MVGHKITRDVFGKTFQLEVKNSFYICMLECPARPRDNSSSNRSLHIRRLASTEEPFRPAMNESCKQAEPGRAAKGAMDQAGNCDSPSASQLSYTKNATKRDLSGVLQLPDVEDTAMAHVFAYIEHYQEDIFWSFLSDSFFVAGGLTFVLLSLWDYLGLFRTELYKALMLIVPLLYLINSIVDIVWANRVRRRSKVRSSMQKLWEESMQTSGDIVDPKTSTAGPGDPAAIGKQEVVASKLELSLCSWKNCTTLWNKIRRHAAHRRTVLAALTFGAAALSAFVSVMIQYLGRAPSMVGLYHNISIHMYIVSAIISVSGKRIRPWLPHSSCVDNHENLEDLGDLFFLFGSVVDGFLCDSPFDDHATTWTLVSALFWLTDACFYLLSDIVMACKFIRQSEESDTLDGTYHSLV